MSNKNTLSIFGGILPIAIPLTRAKLRRSNAQTFAPATNTRILFNIVDYDVGNLSNPATGEITISNLGVYKITGSFSSQASAGDIEISILINGVVRFRSKNIQAGSFISQTVSGSLLLSVGDIVTMEVLSDVANSSGTLVDDRPALEVIEQASDSITTPGVSEVTPASSARILLTGSQNIPGSANTKILFNSIDYDPRSIVNIANSEIVVPNLGFYNIFGSFLPDIANSEFTIQILVNSIVRLEANRGNFTPVGPIGIDVSGTLRLEAGDIITMSFFGFIASTITGSNVNNGRPSLTVIEIPTYMSVNPESTKITKLTTYPVTLTASVSDPVLSPSTLLHGTFNIVGKTLHLAAVITFPDMNAPVAGGSGVYKISLPPGFTINSTLVKPSSKDAPTELWYGTPIGRSLIFKNEINAFFSEPTMGIVTADPSLIAINIISSRGNLSRIRDIWSNSYFGIDPTITNSMMIKVSATIPIL